MGKHVPPLPPYPLRSRVFLASGTFTAPHDGWYRVTAIGGGGSGGCYEGLSKGVGCGGGAGGLCEKLTYLTAGSELTITVGAGGASRSTNLAGADGSATTVTGTGISLTANGGIGGGYGSAISTLYNGGAGGTSSGGDINNTGGAGGNITTTATIQWGSTGGGAVGVYGTGISAQNITSLSSTLSYAGAGVGSVGSTTTSGGALANRLSIKGFTDALNFSLGECIPTGFWGFLIGPGQLTVSENTAISWAPPGCGGFSVNGSTAAGFKAQHAGYCAGGGGLSSSAVSASGSAGQGVWGGGGGGVGIYGNGVSGAGGQGVVIVEY